jgi:nitrate reductase gamma subunit
MMDTWIALARGPLFRVALAVCLLGLAYRVGNTLWQIRRSYRQSGDKRLDKSTVLKATVNGLLPFRLLRVRPLYTIASIGFHLGVLLVPLFYVGHVTLWQSSLPLAWPTLGPAASDALTLIGIAGLVFVLLGRLLIRASRDLTSREDVAILIFLIFLMASGYWAAHAASSPFDPRAMLLTHLLLGNLALILTPLTKIVHCVLGPLTQLLSEVAWHFPAEAGRNVAVVLGKENEPI